MEEALWGQRCWDWVGEVTSETEQRTHTCVCVCARSEVKAGLRQMTDAEDKQVEAIFRELTRVKRFKKGE